MTPSTSFLFYSSFLMWSLLSFLSQRLFSLFSKLHGPYISVIWSTLSPQSLLLLFSQPRVLGPSHWPEFSLPPCKKYCSSSLCVIPLSFLLIFCTFYHLIYIFLGYFLSFPIWPKAWKVAWICVMYLQNSIFKKPNIIVCMYIQWDVWATKVGVDRIRAWVLPFE